MKEFKLFLFAVVTLVCLAAPLHEYGKTHRLFPWRTPFGDLGQTSDQAQSQPAADQPDKALLQECLNANPYSHACPSDDQYCLESKRAQIFDVQCYSQYGDKSNPVFNLWLQMQQERH